MNFSNAMNGEEQIAVTPEVEYGDVKMIFDILNSIEKNEPVAVDTDIAFKQKQSPLKD